MASALTRIAILAVSMTTGSGTTSKADERRCNPSRPVGHVAVVGATHGNERMGLIVVEDLRRAPPKCSFELSTLVGNEDAVRARGTGAGRRYIDCDLNRCFLLKDLTGKGVPEAVEGRRAREIDWLLGPKSGANPRCDLILDLHSTTANTGVLLCLHPRDAFAMQLAAHLRSLEPSIRVGLWPDEDDVSLLPTVARSGLTIEVGACAHSTVVFELLAKMRKVVHDALSYIDLHNACVGAAAGAEPAERCATELPVHYRAYSLDYPKDSKGAISAFIHPALQGVAELVEPLKPSSLIFAALDGTETDLATAMPELGDEEEEEVFPMFCNEAAYYEKGVAVVLAKRRLEPVQYWARKQAGA
jgi:aspartoacylase